MKEEKARFGKILRDFDTAMLVSESLTVNLVARPMAVAGIDPGDDSIYFFTRRDTEKVAEISDDAHVVLSLMSGWKMLSLSGLASVVVDPEKARSYWKDSFGIWFEGGLEDPRLCFIRVEPLEGEYWDNSGFEGVKYVFNVAKAMLGARPPSLESGRHGKVSF